MTRFGPASLLIAQALASCGGGGADGGTTTIAPAGTTVATTTTVVPTTASVATTIPVTMTPPPLLVAHAEGIDLWTSDESTPLLTGRPIALAVPDLRGGVIFQEAQTAFGQALPIEWISTPGDPPETLIECGGALSLHLVQVAEINGSPSVVYRKWVELPNECPAEDPECHWAYHIEYLVLHDLTNGAEVTPGAIGSFESSSLAFDFGGDRVAVVVNFYGEGACAGWLPLSDLLHPTSDWIGEGSKTEQACAVGPTSWCPGDRQCEGMARAAASPDGSLVAYAFAGWRHDISEYVAPRLLIYDPLAGREVLRVEVGEAGVQPEWIDFDGEFVVLGRSDNRLLGEDREIEPLLLDTRGNLQTLPIAGRATFWISSN